MMEYNTDRLFWTLTSVIVGALLLTISVKAFPGVANTITAPLSGIAKQSDKSTKTSDQAYKDAINGVNGSNTNNSSKNSQTNNPDAQRKAKAVEASSLNLKVTPNGDGTGTLNGPASGTISGSLNIPDYVKVNGQLTKITSIGNAAFDNNHLTSVTIPNTIVDIGWSAFSRNELTTLVLPNSITDIKASTFWENQLTSVSIPNTVTSIDWNAFQNNNLTSVNIPNQKAYQSVQANPSYPVFDDTVTLTNNPS